MCCVVVVAKGCEGDEEINIDWLADRLLDEPGGQNLLLTTSLERHTLKRREWI